MTFVHAIKPGGISVGDVVRISSDPNHVRHVWQGLMAEVVALESVEEEKDSLVLRAACGAECFQDVADIRKLDVIEKLAWVGWQARVEAFYQTVEQFKLDRNRENEWITGGEVVRIADDDYAEAVKWLKVIQRQRDPFGINTGDPLTEDDIVYWSWEAWKGRQNWREARVLEPPTEEGGDFNVEITADGVYNTVGVLEKMPWNYVWRIEPTPEDE